LSGRASVPQAAGAYRALLDGLNLLTEAVAAPIGRVKGALATLEQGDLTTRVEGSFAGAFGQMQRTFNSALAALDDGLSKVALTATQVADASSQIATSSQAVAQGATQQAQSLKETGASLTQMLKTTEQSAEGAVQAQARSRTAREASGAGVEAMGRMQHSMERIHQASEATAAIVRDINEIAFQTNLLALNAAVEAARAQDAGRSFGVVADEVRNLALRTKEAARKTEALIRDSIQLAQAGGGVAHQVSANLSSIVAVVGEVSGIIETIAVGSAAQAGEVRTVQGAVANIDRVTQHNASSAAASSSASSAMAARAKELTALVSRYRVSRPPGPGRLRAI
jgi:methyl-accepting chemotaxis protein